jgi:DNA-binding response OmpR family regulator
LDARQLAVGSLVLYVDTNSATWQGKVVVLMAREFAILQLPAERRPRVLSRRQIEDALCGPASRIVSNSVEVNIHHLRRKLAPGAIVTVRGQGDQFGPSRCRTRPPISGSSPLRGPDNAARQTKAPSRPRA